MSGVPSLNYTRGLMRCLLISAFRRGLKGSRAVLLRSLLVAAYSFTKLIYSTANAKSRQTGVPYIIQFPV
jgi:hypothetical protein